MQIVDDALGVARYATFGDLVGTSEAFRLAVASTTTGRAFVHVFNDTPLAFAAVSAPDAMGRIKASVFGTLDSLPADERSLLIDTFGAWLDTGGSTTTPQHACSAIRISFDTALPDRSTHWKVVDRLRDIAEVCLAFDGDRRVR